MNKLLFVIAFIAGMLLTVVTYQDHVIVRQRLLIRQMAQNPNCLIP